MVDACIIMDLCEPFQMLLVDYVLSQISHSSSRNMGKNLGGVDNIFGVDFL